MSTHPALTQNLPARVPASARRRPRRTFGVLAAIAGCLLAIGAAAAPAQAATPFQAGVGDGHDLAVSSDGKAHVAWHEHFGLGDRVGYCRASAAQFGCSLHAGLPFPNGADASSVGDAQVFTPAPNKVVILAACVDCGTPANDVNRAYRWISLNNGTSFGAPVEVGSLPLDGQAGYLNDGDIALGMSDNVGSGYSHGYFQAMGTPGPSSATVDLGGGFPFAYAPAVVRVPGTGKVVHTLHRLSPDGAVKYAVFTDPTPPPITAPALNTDANWAKGKLLSGAEGANSETHLSAGPSGVFLSYQYGLPLDDRLALRRFNSATNTFGAPTYVEGPSPIENSGIYDPHQSQDAAGRVHYAWKSNYGGGRLRYTRSDNGGVTFSAAANLATHEAFVDPLVEAGPNGQGFAVWRGIGVSPIRVVRIDPTPEPAAPSPPDTVKPIVSGLMISDATLKPGQGAKFTFTTSEGGVGHLRLLKAKKALKLKRNGKLTCLKQTKKRVKELSKLVKPPNKKKKLKKLLKKRRCTLYVKIAESKKLVGPGKNTFTFKLDGKNGHKKLSPGRYKAVLTVTDAAGNTSSKKTIKFKVKAKKKKVKK